MNDRWQCHQILGGTLAGSVPRGGGLDATDSITLNHVSLSSLVSADFPASSPWISSTGRVRRDLLVTARPALTAALTNSGAISGGSRGSGRVQGSASGTIYGNGFIGSIANSGSIVGHRSDRRQCHHWRQRQGLPASGPKQETQSYSDKFHPNRVHSPTRPTFLRTTAI